MKLYINIKPHAREDKVEKISENVYHISVKAPPVEGKANEAMIRLVAKYLDISQSSITLLSGHTRRQKILLVPDIL